jgi:dienelactone hydrolase
MRRRGRIFLMVLSVIVLTASAYCEGTAITTYNPIASADVYFPAEGGKYPVVIFAHNGGAKKEDWSDYPQKLAEEGFFVANLGWTENAGSDDLANAIDSILKKYQDRADANRVAFVGGCHGGVKMASLMKSGAAPYRLKAAVFLSISEMISLPKDHVPILGIYATDDHLGGYYKSFTKKLVETIIDEPKKVVAFTGTPHGNELVADPASKDSIRKEVTDWLKEYLKAK